MVPVTTPQGPIAALAFVALGFLLATGIGVPLLVRSLARGLGRKQLELRGELKDRLVDGIQGAQDLLAKLPESYFKVGTAEIKNW